MSIPLGAILGRTLWEASKAHFDGRVTRAIPRVVDNVVRRFFSGRGMSPRGQLILKAFRDSIVKHGKQRLDLAFRQFKGWLLAPENREETAEFLNEEGIEMVEMGDYAALSGGEDMVAAATAAAGASGSSFSELMYALGDALVYVSPIGVGVVEATGGIRAWTDRSDWSNRDHADTPIHPHTSSWWNPMSWGPASDWSNPSDEPPPKRQKTNAVQSGDSFSGLVKTLVNPVTGRIIGYKGIPRKRKFRNLERYSPFWKDHNRLTQQSVLVGPSQA